MGYRDWDLLLLNHGDITLKKCHIFIKLHQAHWIIEPLRTCMIKKQCWTQCFPNILSTKNLLIHHRNNVSQHTSHIWEVNSDPAPLMLRRGEAGGFQSRMSLSSWLSQSPAMITGLNEVLGQVIQNLCGSQDASWSMVFKYALTRDSSFKGCVGGRLFIFYHISKSCLYSPSQAIFIFFMVFSTWLLH